MDIEYTPGIVSPPGDYLREELEARGWTSAEFAEIIARPPQTVSAILNAKKEITPDTAVAIGKAFGTSAELWLGLQASYSLHRSHLAAAPPHLNDIERRARLRSFVPVAECRRRGWITADPNDIDTAETEVAALLGVESLDEPPVYAAAARRANTSEPLIPEQIAWLGRVRQTAAVAPAREFNADELEATASRLARTLRSGPETLPQVPEMFAACGVRVVFCEGLKGGKLDGAATFLPDRKAVIGLTTRGNRFDIVLFTLLHECAHIVLGHVTPETPDALLDEDIATTTRSGEIEADADELAKRWLLPRDFKMPAASHAAAQRCADEFGLHISVVIGQIQRETKRWDLLRRSVPQVRPALEQAGLMA